MHRSASVHHRPAVRCATIRFLFGLSLFAATGAGAGSSAHAASHVPADAPAAVVATR